MYFPTGDCVCRYGIWSCLSLVMACFINIMSGSLGLAVDCASLSSQSETRNVSLEDQTKSVPEQVCFLGETANKSYKLDPSPEFSIIKAFCISAPSTSRLASEHAPYLCLKCRDTYLLLFC